MARTDRLLATLAVLGAVALAAPDASAEIKGGELSLSPSIGGYVFDGDQNLKHSFQVGAGLGYHFDPNWGTEFVFNYVNASTKLLNTGVDVFSYRFDGLYHFMPDKKLVPFVAFGLGGITFDPDLGLSDTDFLLGYGGGLKYFVLPNLILRGDVRHIVSFGKTNNNFLYSVGMSFFLGGKSDAPAPRAPVAPVTHGDSDRDGVTDDRDRCPETPAGHAVDGTGCSLDSDRDGVNDAADRCPNTPSGSTVDDRGCGIDSDADGVADRSDQCPATPQGARVDGRGCWVLEGAHFDTSKAAIKPASFSRLAEVLAVLRANPDLRVEISGHTDNTGPLAFNQTLSANRARAVMEYFVAKGVAGSRLEARGFGPSQPVASNDSVEGRAKNRRVELKPLIP